MSRKSDLTNILVQSGHSTGPWTGPGTSLSGLIADGRLFGLNAGDWTVLISGFGLSALAVLLLGPQPV
jgi:hypothetical protein